MTNTHGVYRWEAGGVHVASVARSRSWVRYGQENPWFIEIFGSRNTAGLADEWFRTLDIARTAAELQVRRIVADVARALDASSK